MTGNCMTWAFSIWLPASMGIIKVCSLVQRECEKAIDSLSLFRCHVLMNRARQRRQTNKLAGSEHIPESVNAINGERYSAKFCPWNLFVRKHRNRGGPLLSFEDLNVLDCVQNGFIVFVTRDSVLSSHGFGI